MTIETLKNSAFAYLHLISPSYLGGCNNLMIRRCSTHLLNTYDCTEQLATEVSATCMAEIESRGLTSMIDTAKSSDYMICIRDLPSGTERFVSLREITDCGLGHIVNNPASVNAS